MLLSIREIPGVPEFATGMKKIMRVIMGKVVAIAYFDSLSKAVA